jgi:hypothetical protein
MISDEQKLEIREFVEAQSAQWTDFVSMLDETLGLYQKPPKQAPNTLDDVMGREEWQKPQKLGGENGY